ncbi:hypothetical protein IW261DRAFT_1012030 [Armillaria novae-zelandiae]|uniref:Uncharacterized protein n=1 Tax=Armillaria novae-zelandiae TaxID=153914 RepID=A0AA39NNK0_9AGAR|nr:hypothetical protein IW261DRAFT_1012030 [Armillaria novae-zelandiae]
MTPFGSLRDSPFLFLHRPLLAVVGDLATIAVARRTHIKIRISELRVAWSQVEAWELILSFLWAYWILPLGCYTLVMMDSSGIYPVDDQGGRLPHISISMIGSSNS